MSATAVDRAGAAASIACAVHCVATPLVVVLAPTLGAAWPSGEPVEWALTALPVALTLGQLVGVVRAGARPWRAALLLGLGAVALLVVRPALEEWAALEAGSVVLGAGLVLAAQRCARRARATCECRACPAPASD